MASTKRRGVVAATATATATGRLDRLPCTLLVCILSTASRGRGSVSNALISKRFADIYRGDDIWRKMYSRFILKHGCMLVSIDGGWRSIWKRYLAARRFHWNWGHDIVDEDFDLEVERYAKANGETKADAFDRILNDHDVFRHKQALTSYSPGDDELLANRADIAGDPVDGETVVYFNRADGSSAVTLLDRPDTPPELV